MRNFPNFLKTYSEYAKDGFSPDEFHHWAAMSIIAGAMERKCWLPFSTGYKLFPNMYIFLVADPGIGKSASGRLAVDDLLAQIPDMTFIPSQISEAKLIDLMSARKTFEHGGEVHNHSSGYYYASEASASLKEINGGGEILGCFTEFYDCNRKFEKATVSRGKVTLKNVCFNLLAGCTPSYLKELIPDSQIQGGFASRVIYILHDANKKRVPNWLDFDAAPGRKKDVRDKLLNDLMAINEMKGAFRWTEGYRAKFMADFNDFEDTRIVLTSNNKKAILSRKHLNIMKVSMILSAAHDNSMVLDTHHWDIAHAMVNEVEKKYDKVLSISQSNGLGKQATLNSAILEIVGRESCKRKSIERKLLNIGHDPFESKKTIDSMVGSGILVYAKGLISVASNLNSD